MSFCDLRFGFLMYPGFEELDLIGPWEMATMWRTYAEGPECVTVAQSATEMRCAKGLRVAADLPYDEVGQLDYLLIPGGFATFDEIKNLATIEFIRHQAKGTRAVLSVCTGTFLLHAAGLIEGRQVSTNWKMIQRLRDVGAHVVEERYAHDGKIWSSAGVAAGIDMMLAFIAHEAGDEVAWRTQYQSEYIPEVRYFGRVSSWEGAPAYAIKQLAGK